MKIKSKKRKWITRTDIVGYLFIMPFLIGFVFFFLKPMINSLIYSFHKVSFGAEGLIMEKVGWANYEYALFGDAGFLKALLTMGANVIVKILVIMFLSMFVSILLNQEFPGRLFFRVAMFMPVIFGADVVMESFMASEGYDMLSSDSNQFITIGSGAQNFLNELIGNFGVVSDVVGMFTGYIASIFDLAWEMGIQVILFIIGLKAIPDYLYEVCSLEGATKWEEFWKITFPMLSPTILLCLIYTVIDTFNSNNEVAAMIADNVQFELHYACAQTWLYSLIVFVIVALIYKIVSNYTVYLD